ALRGVTSVATAPIQWCTHRDLAYMPWFTMRGIQSLRSTGPITGVRRWVYGNALRRARSFHLVRCNHWQRSGSVGVVGSLALIGRAGGHRERNAKCDAEGDQNSGHMA